MVQKKHVLWCDVTAPVLLPCLLCAAVHLVSPCPVHSCLLRSTEGSKKKPPNYKVMLHNDNYNRREYVVRVLLKVVEEVRSAEDAAKVMQEAHETGVALVVATAQDKAEEYVEGLRLNGLVSTMEPGH